MSLKDNINAKTKQFHKFLVDPKVVRFCIRFTLVFFPLMIFFGVLVAVFLGPTNYNIMDNYISDMGSYRYTPIPKFLDDGVMITSIMLVPVCFYIKKIFDLKSKELENVNVSPAYSTVVLITMLIGMFGIFSAGFFNEDMGISLYPFIGVDLHEVFTVVEFVGVAIAGLLIGIILVRFPKGIIEMFGYEKMSKLVPVLLGLIMIFLTPILCIFFLLGLPPSEPFWEWMLMFSMFGWLFVIGIITLHQINTDEVIENKKTIHEFLVDPIVVKRTVIFSQIYFPLMIIIAVLVAVFMGPTNFNIFDNYISDTGSYRYTPIPKFLDSATTLTSILLVPVCFYIKKNFDLKSEQLDSLNVSTKYSSVVLITMLIGMFGIFTVGFFSEDVAIALYPYTTSAYDLHDILTVVQFVGVAGGGLLIGIIFVRYPQGIIELCGYENLSKKIIFLMGIIMIFLTPVFCTLFLLGLPPSEPFWEWMLFFSIYGWIPPIGIMILHQIKTEELQFTQKE